MSQLTESVAETLPQAQAAGLARVIDLQAQWENLRDKPGRPASDYSTPDLHGRQKAYEAFRVVKAEYAAQYRASEVPEMTLNTPERVAGWCKAVRAVFRRAETGPGPVAAVEKAYRMADRIALRLKVEAIARNPVGTATDAIASLNAVIQWCDMLALPVVLKEAA